MDLKLGTGVEQGTGHRESFHALCVLTAVKISAPSCFALHTGCSCPLLTRQQGKQWRWSRSPLGYTQPSAPGLSPSFFWTWLRLVLRRFSQLSTVCGSHFSNFRTFGRHPNGAPSCSLKEGFLGFFKIMCKALL